MRILGLDPGNAHGYAVTDEGARIVSGVWQLVKRPKEAGGVRFRRLADHLAQVIEQHRPELVAYERVDRHLGTRAAHVYGGYIAVIMAVCERLAVPYMAVPVYEAKRAGAGHARASKQAMIDAASERWQFAPGCDNEADALWLSIAAGLMLHRDR